MDVFVRPEARGKGVGLALFTAWSDNVEVALGLGLTPSSYGLFKKLRYDDVGPVPFFQKRARRRARVAAPAAGAAAGRRWPARPWPPGWRCAQPERRRAARRRRGAAR